MHLASSAVKESDLVVNLVVLLHSCSRGTNENICRKDSEKNYPIGEKVTEIEMRSQNRRHNVYNVLYLRVLSVAYGTFMDIYSVDSGRHVYISPILSTIPLSIK